MLTVIIKAVSVMFEMTVKNYFAASHLGRNRVDVIGVGMKGSAKIGDVLTDGKNKYEILGIPMLNRVAQNFDEVNISINTDDPDALVGKTLLAV